MSLGSTNAEFPFLGSRTRRESTVKLAPTLSRYDCDHTRVTLSSLRATPDAFRFRNWGTIPKLTDFCHRLTPEPDLAPLIVATGQSRRTGEGALPAPSLPRRGLDAPVRRPRGNALEKHLFFRSFYYCALGIALRLNFSQRLGVPRSDVNFCQLHNRTP
jgi:hypothetical protein